MDRHKLAQQIREWNANRLDLFELSEPNEDGEFFGVMRFFYQDDEKKVSTKCIRVSSTAKTVDILGILIEKFRPDLRMLSPSQYALYEVHATGDERKILDVECPLLIQLNWGNDDREGRFLLKKVVDKTKSVSGSTVLINSMGLERRLSRREKKELKKQEKSAKFNAQENEKENTAQTLYSAVPESSFTRSISNPEMVMRRRRQMKLERKLQEIRTSDGGPNSGGTLKIYGDALCPDVPYKTLLLSVNDTAMQVVRETLDKYGLESENELDYSLVQVVHPSDAEEFYGKQRQEYILDDDDCPLEILLEMPPTTGPVTFRLIRRPIGTNVFKSSLPAGSPQESLPYIVEINADGTVPYDAHEFYIPAYGLEIGLEKSPQHAGSFLKLVGPDICRHQCLLSNSKGVITVTPLDRSAAVYINDYPVNGTTLMANGATLLLGRGYLFRLLDPIFEQRQKVPENMAQLSPSRANESRMPPTLPSTDEQITFDDFFPATVEYHDNREVEFVTAICTSKNIESLEFKLMPTYMMYMAARHNLSRQRLQRLSSFTSSVAHTVYNIIQRVQGNPLSLGLWMANASELLNFFSRDVHIGPNSTDAQNVLSECVQMSFFMLVDCLQERLLSVMHTFFDPANDARAIQDSVLSMLSAVISMLLRARVNAALTIQLFSQLFHFINMSLFNRLVSTDSPLCTRAVGRLLLRRLRYVEDWAEKQGLELAAECHLARVIQAAIFLDAPKASADDIADISSSCFKLNSLQLRALLSNYLAGRDELLISPELIERAVTVAQNTADALARKEGAQVSLFEDIDLHLPFLMPEDGYSCDFVKGLSEEMMAFLEPFQRAGLCRLIVNQQSRGSWAVFLTKAQNASGRGAFPVMDQERAMPVSAHPQATHQPDVITVTFQKIKNSIGLSIIAASAESHPERSIYVKSVIPAGAAARDGRLQAGDQILEVDGQSLTGLTQEQAAELLIRSGNVVTLKVAKQAAHSHGLGMILDLPSPSQQEDMNYVNSAPYTTQQNHKAPELRDMVPSGTQRYHTGPPPVSQYPAVDSTVPSAERMHAYPAQSTGPIYAKPHAYRNAEPPVSRSKSASNINQADDMIRSQVQPPADVKMTSQPHLSTQNNYQDPTQYRNTLPAHDNRQTGQSGTRRSDPRMNGSSTVNGGRTVYDQSQPIAEPSGKAVGSFSSQPDLSASRSVRHDPSLTYTSPELLLRAQPGKRSATDSIVSSTVVASSQVKGIPVGGHLSAVSSTSSEQLGKPRQPMAAEKLRQQQVAVSPWDREQKEAEQKRRDVEQRQKRDEEIRHLESRPARELSAAEADHLRKLKLQAAFDKRATEANMPSEFQEYNTDMTPAGRAQVVNHLHQEMDQKRRQLQQQFEQRDRQLAQAEQARMAQQERQLKHEYQPNADVRTSDVRNQRQRQQVVGRSDVNEYNVTDNNGNHGNEPPPPPPERTSSYNMYNTAPASNRKTVSFQPPTGDPDNRQLADPPTPGVVGAQELYRDPRDRIQSTRGQTQPNYQTPERMSFRDKMRRFAAEAGEDTPVDKAKISRAEQLIEMSSGR